MAVVNPPALEFGAGRVLFYGLAVCMAALAVRPRVRRPWARSVASVLSVVAAGLVVLSATPMPWWLYALWVASAVGALAAQEVKRAVWPAFGSLAAMSALVAVLEVPHHATPDVPPIGGRRIFAIGDSISTAWEPGTGAWPDVLRARRGLDIVNLAEPGATTGRALHQAGKIPPGQAFVIVEIGGNDLLGEGGAAEFERELDALLAALVGPGRTVVMLELPLPPFEQAYGLAQRRLAAAHGVTLIPKRYFTRVLGGKDATVDGLHLSPRGQELMAEAIWEVVGPAGR